MTVDELIKLLTDYKLAGASDYLVYIESPDNTQDYFVDKLRFDDKRKQVFLDAEAIRFMNEMPGRLLKAINSHDALLAACEDGVKFLNSLPKSCCRLAHENRTVFHGMLINAIAAATSPESRNDAT
ncbi:MAG: hypothetical protein ACYS1A_18350 [Planctomycetota bacterium]|jgi:hypothetical protein